MSDIFYSRHDTVGYINIQWHIDTYMRYGACVVCNAACVYSPLKGG